MGERDLSKIVFYDDRLNPICLYSPPEMPHAHGKVIRYPLLHDEDIVRRYAGVLETESVQVEVVAVQFFKMHHRNSSGIVSHTWYGITQRPDLLRKAFRLE